MNNSVFAMETVPLKFGWGVLQEIGFDLESMGLKKVMLLSDPHVARLDFTIRALDCIREKGIEVCLYDRVLSEPTDESWLDAIQFAKDQGDLDGFVAIGGGSTIDTAKAVNLYSTYPDDLFAYINKPVGEGKQIPGPLKPLIAAPTTAGTASETTAVAILDILSMHVKTGVANKKLRPCLAIIDPETTLSLPPLVTASCALDVLTHAIESYSTLAFDQRPVLENPALRPPYMGANPIADIWCENAIKLGAKDLVRVYEYPGDREARANLMLAATYAGFGFGNAGVHIPHAMGYPIAGMNKTWVPDDYPRKVPMVPHGISVILGSPAAFRFIGQTVPQRLLQIYEMMGGDSSGLDENEAGDAVAEQMIQIMKKLKIPNGLSEMGFSEDQIPALAEGAMQQQRLLVNSPREIGLEDLKELFRQTMTIW